MKQRTLPLSYGPASAGRAAGTRTRILVVKSDVVPSAFVANFSTMATSEMRGASRFHGLRASSLKRLVGDMYSHWHSPSEFCFSNTSDKIDESFSGCPEGGFEPPRLMADQCTLIGIRHDLFYQGGRDARAPRESRHAAPQTADCELRIVE